MAGRLAKKLFAICLAVLITGQGFGVAEVFAQAKPFEIVLSDMPFLSQREKHKDLGYGLLVDILMEMAEQRGWALKIHFYPINRARRAFVQGEVPFTLGNPSYFSDLGLSEEKIGFIPVFAIGFYLFYHSSGQQTSLDFTGPEQLSAYRFGVKLGTPTLGFYEQAGVKPSFFESARSGIRMLQRQRFDVVEITGFEAKQVLLEEYPDGDYPFVMREDPIYTLISNLLYRRDDPESHEMVEEFREALHEMRASGRYKAIHEKYWGGELPDSAYLH